MKSRSISRILAATTVDLGGMPVMQALPSDAIRQIDPFLLLHHADIKVPTHATPGHAGVGPHPHRGFSPVTFIFKGGVHHRDSRGNDRVIYAGGAQWMNAGMGIIHSERPPHDIHERGGLQEIIQLWINTPSRHKMDAPAYYPVAAEEVPEFVSEDGKVRIRVFAGYVHGLNGPIPTHTEINAATIAVSEGARINIPLPVSHNAFIYLLDGGLLLDGIGDVAGLNLAHFRNDGEGISVEAKKDTRLLLVSGVPLDEKVVSYGPYVMTHQTEIMEAMRDYQKGKMGILIEE
ncbi:MAG: pirin family protein [Cytophagales bacterium]|nr:pirin family protein [Cytophagales bacterium]